MRVYVFVGKSLVILFIATLIGALQASIRSIVGESWALSIYEFVVFVAVAGPIAYLIWVDGLKATDAHRQAAASGGVGEGE